MSRKDNRLTTSAALDLMKRVPPGWVVSDPVPSRRSTEAVELLSICAPDRRTGQIRLLPCHSLDPRQAQILLRDLGEDPPRDPVLVVSPYLTSLVRTRLAEAGVSFLDLTGNVRLVLSQPGLSILATGADRQPGRVDRPARSLRGAKAGQIVRALCDFCEPQGVRELAARAGVDPGYVSRVLTFLDRQTLVDRPHRGGVIRCHWRALLERWATDAPLERRGEHRWLVARQGLAALRTRLERWKTRYGLSGHLAATQVVPGIPVRSAVLYVEDADLAIQQLDLREVSSGANVDLVEVDDELPFLRSHERRGARFAAWSQVAADLLGSGQEGAVQAGALLDWMAAHEGDWRQGSTP